MWGKQDAEAEEHAAEARDCGVGQLGADPGEHEERKGNREMDERVVVGDGRQRDHADHDEEDLVDEGQLAHAQEEEQGGTEKGERYVEVRAGGEINMVPGRIGGEHFEAGEEGVVVAEFAMCGGGVVAHESENAIDGSAKGHADGGADEPEAEQQRGSKAGDADEEGAPVARGKEQREQHDGVELEGGGHAEERGREHGAVAQQRGHAECGDEPEDELDIGALEKKEQRP